jgi:hypothetical protein
VRRTPVVAILVAGFATSAQLAVAPAQAAEQAANSLGIRLVDAPLSAQNDPRAQLYIVDQLAPNSATSRRIEIANTSSATMSVRLYASAAHNINDQFSWATGQVASELTRWTHISSLNIQIPSGGSVFDTITITVPKTVNSGVRNGVIWAEVKGPAAPDGVATVNRVGVRMYVTVAAGNIIAPNFTIEKVTAARLTNGRPAVTALVHNTGGRALTFSGTLNLSHGPLGVRAGPFSVTSSNLVLPGETKPIATVLDPRFADGPWTASVSLTTGSITRQADARVTFVPAATPRTQPNANKDSSGPSRDDWSLSIFALLLSVSVLILGGGIFRARHPRRRVPSASSIDSSLPKHAAR